MKTYEVAQGKKRGITLHNSQQGLLKLLFKQFYFPPASSSSISFHMH